MKAIIDATSGSLGRIASHAAKQALLGKEVVIVNCSRVLVTGNPKPNLDKYKKAIARGGWALKGPNFPRSPEKIMKRTIRGMLPYKQGRGAAALKKIKCYNSVPEELKDQKAATMKREVKVRAQELSKVSKNL